LAAEAAFYNTKESFSIYLQPGRRIKIISVTQTQAVNRSAVKEMVVVVYPFDLFKIRAYLWNK
jgi:hypothetical protein